MWVSTEGDRWGLNEGAAGAMGHRHGWHRHQGIGRREEVGGGQVPREQGSGQTGPEGQGGKCCGRHGQGAGVRGHLTPLLLVPPLVAPLQW